MSDYNVHQKKEPGRTTQYMSENFSDLANMANEKLLDSSVSKEHKIEVLNEIKECLETALEKADHIPQSKKLQKIMAKIKTDTEHLEDYIEHL